MVCIFRQGTSEPRAVQPSARESLVRTVWLDDGCGLRAVIS